PLMRILNKYPDEFFRTGTGSQKRSAACNPCRCSKGFRYETSFLLRMEARWLIWDAARLQAPFRAGHRHVAARIRTHAAPGRSQTNAGKRRAADRSDRQ